ncbi:hypothetical protein [Streptomyces mirabilis]
MRSRLPQANVLRCRGRVGSASQLRKLADAVTSLDCIDIDGRPQWNLTNGELRGLLIGH